jgi:hypothetical protein
MWLTDFSHDSVRCRAPKGVPFIFIFIFCWCGTAGTARLRAQLLPLLQALDYPTDPTYHIPHTVGNMDPKNVVKLRFRNLLVQAVESIFDPRVVNVEGVKETETFIFKPTTRSLPTHACWFCAI